MDEYVEKSLIVSVSDFRALPLVVADIPNILEPDIGKKGIILKSHDYPDGNEVEIAKVMNKHQTFGWSSTVIYEVKFLVPTKYFTRQKLLSQTHIFEKIYEGTVIMDYPRGIRKPAVVYLLVWLP